MMSDRKSATTVLAFLVMVLGPLTSWALLVFFAQRANEKFLKNLPDRPPAEFVWTGETGRAMSAAEKGVLVGIDYVDAETGAYVALNLLNAVRVSEGDMLCIWEARSRRDLVLWPAETCEGLSPRDTYPPREEGAISIGEMHEMVPASYFVE